MATPKLEKCPRVLVVEGYSDLLFYAEMLEWVGNGSGAFIKEMGGRSNVRANLETVLSEGLLQQKAAIGVIVDADTNGVGMAQSLEQRLTALTKQDVKINQWTAGTPRIGLYIVPGGGKAGEVESLAWEAWSNDPVNAAEKTCIDSFLDCMKASGREAHSPDKGRIGALLAVRYDEDPRLGPGARTKSVFDFNRPEFAPLVAFLRDF